MVICRALTFRYAWVLLDAYDLIAKAWVNAYLHRVRLDCANRNYYQAWKPLNL